MKITLFRTMLVIAVIALTIKLSLGDERTKSQKIHDERSKYQKIYDKRNEYSRANGLPIITPGAIQDKTFSAAPRRAKAPLKINIRRFPRTRRSKPKTAPIPTIILPIPFPGSYRHTPHVPHRQFQHHVPHHPVPHHVPQSQAGRI